jgi:hypothetical protein
MANCKTDRSRVDAIGRAYAGSQRQIQRYVNDSHEVLDKAIVESLGASLPPWSRIHWVSPLKTENYAEYRDGDFLRALGMQQLESGLLTFWPKGGPCWDALAYVSCGDGLRRGCILVEAKSHVNEMFGNGCCASDRASRQQICEALRRTKKWLGVSPEADWMGRLYQSANRYAHLYFLRAVAKIDAFLVNVYFVDDDHSTSPTTIHGWKPAIGEVKQQLGLRSVPFSGEVFLSAIP